MLALNGILVNSGCLLYSQVLLHTSEDQQICTWDCKRTRLNSTSVYTCKERGRGRPCSTQEINFQKIFIPALLPCNDINFSVKFNGQQIGTPYLKLYDLSVKRHSLMM